jgi:hypothetical protein
LDRSCSVSVPGVSMEIALNLEVRECAEESSMGHAQGPQPINIPSIGGPTNGQTPMQRFLSTPPKDDPVPLAVIEKAASVSEKSSMSFRGEND